jgi:enamine deaminase RidA (YjgF/YER057c/UK114 family)
MSVDEGYEAARVTIVNVLASMKAVIGDLDRIRQFVMVLAWVVCTPDFTEHALVSNGATDLLMEAFGDRGKHARATLGIQSLVSGFCYEAYVVAEVGDRAVAQD